MKTLLIRYCKYNNNNNNAPLEITYEVITKDKHVIFEGLDSFIEMSRYVNSNNLGGHFRNWNTAPVDEMHIRKLIPKDRMRDTDTSNLIY